MLYALQIWSCSKSGPINEIFKMQKKAIRIVSGASYNAHTEPLFKKLQVLPLPDLISFTKIQFMQRFKQKFYHHPLKKHGYLMTSETLDKMTFNCVIMIKFNLYIPPLQA